VSDVNTPLPDPGLPAGEPPPEPAAAEPAAPITPEYVAELRRQAESYRQRAQAFESRFGGLDNDTLDSLGDFAELVRSGDPDAARWAIESAKNLAGPSWSQLVSQYGQAGAAQVVAQAAAAEGVAIPTASPNGDTPLTRQALEDLLNQRDAKAAAERDAQAQRDAYDKANAAIDNELHQNGIVPGSATAMAVRATALEMTREQKRLVTITEALPVYRQQAAGLLGVTLPPTAGGPGAVAPAGGGVPNVAVDDGKTPRQRMMERLAADSAGGVR
jgi:hypothetical protein